MAIHDRYLRRTPFERFIPDPEFPERHFEAIEAEAKKKRMPLSDPGTFGMLEAGAEALSELRRPSDEPETLAQHSLVLFHAFHYEKAERPAFLMETPVVRALVETEPWEGDVDGDAPQLPASSYIQLPQHLVWARTGSGPPASVDGFFRTIVMERRLHLLPVVGLLEGRPGFTVLPLPGLPLGDAPTWATADMRQGGEDFASEMPGSDMERLYEVQTAGEVLKLLARATAWIRRFPDGVGGPGSAADTRDADARGDDEPAPSGLAGRRITLGADA